MTPSSIATLNRIDRKIQMKKQIVTVHKLMPSPFETPAAMSGYNFAASRDDDTRSNLDRIKVNIAATRIQANAMLATAHDIAFLTEAVERLQEADRAGKLWAGHAASVIRAQADALASIHPSHRKHVRLSP